jgi:ABC-2 type transport system permease protein
MISRIAGMVLRYLFIYKRSVIRIAELIFFPLMDLLVWGFVTLYLEQITQSKTVVFLLGGIVLWDIFFRAQQAVGMSVLQEMWVGNTLNLFVSPLRSYELVISTAIVGFIRALITASGLGLCAYFLYSFNLLEIGISLVPLFGLLLFFGWALGLFTASLILRYGEAAESLAWIVPFLVQPFVAVFYPVSALPPALQTFSQIFPCTHIFEGMRSVLHRGGVPWLAMGTAFLLTLVWTTLTGTYFARTLNYVRRKGYLTTASRG